jgi:hypothetical protein
VSREEDHAKLVGFLSGEFVKPGGHQCIKVELVYAPGGGYKEEPLRDWVRELEPEKFEISYVPTLVSHILEVAESEADAKEPRKHRFVIKTLQFMGSRQSTSIMLAPAYGGADDTMAMVAPGQGGRQNDQLIANHANQLLRVNTQMFDGTIRTLIGQNNQLVKAEAELRAENILLRREVEEARSSKIEKELQVMIAADKNNRANQTFQKLLQIGSLVAAKIGAPEGVAALTGQPSPLQVLLADFGKSLRQDQVMSLQKVLDESQLMMFFQIMTMVAEQTKAPPPGAPGGDPPK